MNLTYYSKFYAENKELAPLCLWYDKSTHTWGIMNKIAAYLSEHIVGDITGAKHVRSRFSRDASVLEITPDLVMFPRVTNDIRKAARFAWQLAEKGHVLPLTMRGDGTDTTGGAIGSGLVIVTSTYLDNIIQLNAKDKLVHVQPGVRLKTLLDTLSWQSSTIPAFVDNPRGTVGGALGKNIGSRYTGRNGLAGDAVERLEVVLANGDLIETGPVSKRDVSKKIGLQTFEGEIYRKLDALLEDNAELISSQLDPEARDNGGYAQIARIKDEHGNYNLTPLFLGTQGTLGIISEVVLRTELINPVRAALIAYLPDKSTGRDAAEALKSLQPAALETLDAELFAAAVKAGRMYSIAFEPKDGGCVVYAEFDDVHDRKREKKLKKALKKLEDWQARSISTLDQPVEAIEAMRHVAQSLGVMDHGRETFVPLLDGASVPSERFEAFRGALYDLAAKHHMELPLIRRILDDTFSLKPLLDLGKVADKQKVFKLTQDFAKLVTDHGGVFIAEGAEGRLKSNALRATTDDEVVRLYDEIRAIFDPYGTLNPSVKQSVQAKELVSALTSSYDAAINL